MDWMLIIWFWFRFQKETLIQKKEKKNRFPQHANCVFKRKYAFYVWSIVMLMPMPMPMSTMCFLLDANAQTTLWIMEINYTLATSRITYDGEHAHSTLYSHTVCGATITVFLVHLYFCTPCEFLFAFLYTNLMRWCWVRALGP